MNWQDISYLKVGTKRQREAYRALISLNVFEVLAGYSPILVGTIPLDLDTQGSDLDIICEVTDLDRFEMVLREQFAGQAGFSLRKRTHNRLPVVVCNFVFSGFPVEIFGQPRPVRAQNAYRHMVAEARLLSLAGAKAKAAIQHLKTQGIKTEPAFGEYFALPGDPFEALLALTDASDADLNKAIKHATAIKGDCLFCRIVAGQEAVSVVHRDIYTMAFMNQRQANPGHVLVIPRRHVEQIDDLEQALAANLMQTVVEVSRGVRATFEPVGLNVWQSNGGGAGQEIPHIHFHIFPRQANDGYFSPYPNLPPIQERGRLEALAEQIKEKLDPPQIRSFCAGEHSASQSISQSA